LFEQIEHFIRQFFAELHSFLIKGIDPPNKSLERDFVLIKSQQSAQCIGGKLFTEQNTARPGGWKILGRGFAIFTGSQRDGLRKKIREQLLLRSSLFNS